MTGMTPPAGCPAEEVLKAYVDRESPADEQAIVRAHLDGCPHCTEEVEIMKLIGTELRGLESAVEPPAGLRGRILSRIDFTPERRRRSGLSFLRWASLAAGAVVILCVAYNLSPLGEIARQMRMGRRGVDFTGGTEVASAPATPLPDNQGFFSGSGGSFDGHAKSVAGQPMRQMRQRSSSWGGGMREQDYDEVTPRRNGNAYSPMSRTNPFHETRGLKDVETSVPTVAAVGKPASSAVSDVDRYARGKLDGPVSRKVFQSADLSVRIDRKLESEQDEIAGHLKKLGGYVEESSLSSPEGSQERVADMVLRAPVDQFEGTLSWLSGLGDVTAKNLSGKDVTSNWIDERAVLRELRKEETRLAKELDQARKPAVIQSLRWQLLQLRPRIAAAEEQFAATSKLAALATIRLKLLERPEARVRGNLLDDMGRTAHSALAAFLVALRVPAAFLIWLAVFTPLWLPCLLLYRWATKKLDAERRRTHTETFTADPVA